MIHNCLNQINSTQNNLFVLSFFSTTTVVKNSIGWSKFTEIVSYLLLFAPLWNARTVFNDETFLSWIPIADCNRQWCLHFQTKAWPNLSAFVCRLLRQHQQSTALQRRDPSETKLQGVLSPPSAWQLFSARRALYEPQSDADLKCGKFGGRR